MRRKRVVLAVAASALILTVAALLCAAAFMPTSQSALLPCLADLKPDRVEAAFESDSSPGRRLPRGAYDVTLVQYIYKWNGDEKALVHRAQAEMLAKNFRITGKPSPTFRHSGNIRLAVVSGIDGRGNTMLVCAVVKPSKPDTSTLVVSETHIATTAEKVQRWLRRTLHWNGNIGQSRSNVKWVDRP